MQIGDQARALLTAQQLVPDWAARDLEMRLGENQVRAGNLANAMGQRQLDADVEQARIARERAAAKNRAVIEFDTDPSAERAFRLMADFPELRDPIKETWCRRDALQNQGDLKLFAQLMPMLSAGRAKEVDDLLTRRVDADNLAFKGQERDDVIDFGTIRQLARDNPKHALSAITGLMSAIIGPEKFADTFAMFEENRRADEAQPFELERKRAEASKATTEADYAPQVIQSGLANDEARRQDIASQIQTRVDQLSLQRDQLETQVQLKLEEMDRTGANPDPGSVKLMNDAVIESQSNAVLAQQTNNLADQFAASPARGGMFSGLAEMSKGFFGGQDGVSLLRSRYEQLTNSTAIKMLPPGPATDKDIQLVRRGFPPASAPREYLVSWLRGMAKLQDIQAAHDDRRAGWIAGNGNLGPAKRDIVVGGVQVPKGTSFAQFQQYTGKRQSQGQLPERSYMRFAR